MNDPDKIVFHYTSFDGFLGMTNSASIWGTNILYLNDASEFIYAKALLSQELHRFCQTNSGFTKGTSLDESLGYYFFEIVEENVNKLLPSENFSFYVCSFSEEPDLLSQWRGYCKNGTGCSLGFGLNRLREIAERARFAIKPCIYDEREQVDAIRALLQKFSGRFLVEVGGAEEKGAAWDSKSKYIAVDFLQEFIQLAPFIKHPKFKEEREWRIMAGLKTNHIRSQLRFRPGNSMIVPYIEIPLPMEEEQLLIDELFLGPTNERELSMASVELLLKARNVRCCKVNCSSIPYRAI